MPHEITVAAAKSANPLQSFVDFFGSPTWGFLARLSVFFLVALWLACAFWVFKDARRRIDDKLVLIAAVLTGLVFGPFGLIIYSIIRPAELISDRRERELEMEVMERRLGDVERCTACGTPLQDDFLVCPTCGQRLRTLCASCGKLVDSDWRLCPYCGTEQRGPAATAHERV